MMFRSLAVWFAILVLAAINGGFRDLALTPALGDTVARAISTVALCSLIAAVAWLTIRWIGPSNAARTGVLWLVLTLAFEFLGGRYLFGKTWTELLADYDVTRGRIWLIVPFVTLLAPLWAARARGHSRS